MGIWGLGPIPNLHPKLKKNLIVTIFFRTIFAIKKFYLIYINRIIVIGKNNIIIFLNIHTKKI